MLSGHYSFANDVCWKKDTSESDGLGALVGDLPDSGSGKPLVGHQRVPAGSPSHPRTVVGWDLYWGIRENKRMAMLVFLFEVFSLCGKTLLNSLRMKKGRAGGGLCGFGKPQGGTAKTASYEPQRPLHRRPRPTTTST